MAPSGKVDVYNAFGTADLVVDLDGYFATTGGGSGYFPLNPTRVCDSRPAGAGVASNACDTGGAGALNPAQTRAVGVDGTNVSAVVDQVTVVNTAANGYLAAYPSSASQPAPDFFWAKGQITGDFVTVAVGADPHVAVTNDSTGTTDLVVDPSGYYSPTGP